MKKIASIAFLVIMLCLVLINTDVKAQSSSPTVTKAPTATPSPEEGSALDKVRILKEKVATKVAELRQTEKTGIQGAVEDVSDSEIKIKNGNGTVTVSYSENTPLFTIVDEKKEAEVDDIKKGSTILALGFYDEDQKALDSRVIYITNPKPAFLSGKILSLDRENFTVTLKGKDGKQSVIDIETYSRTNSIGDKNVLVKSGFSKLINGDAVQILGTPNEDTQDRYSANRILVIDSKSGALTPSPTPEDE